ncbi:hypothetical protein ABC347_07890 [Sphingomonas sp. 1P06PA]|uniref:hypothetical protein n=1 Tax=Sphingomonas sp. 1P06PA TaxID=554121 RepID=UPI0039A5BEE4
MSTAPQFHGKRVLIPASLILEAAGESLSAIRKEDSLTFSDLGRALGKSEDRARAYTLAEADMGLVSFISALNTWNGRFANKVLALANCKAVRIQTSEEASKGISTKLAEVSLKVAIALENDGLIDDDELADMAPEIERLGDAIDALRARLHSPRSLSVVA